MRKAYLFLVIFLALAAWSESLTVIFKNGKTLNATLVSETDDTVVVRDEKGVVFSLKKASLDLEKMKSANPETSNSHSNEKQSTNHSADTQEPQKKEPKVYTSEDIDRLRNKYGVSKDQVDSGEAEMVKLSAEVYYKELQDAADRATEVIKSLASVCHEISTIWTVSAQTGKNPNQWISDFMSRDASKKIATFNASEIKALKASNSRLSLAPEEYPNAPQDLNLLINYVMQYDNALQEYMISSAIEQGPDFFQSIQDKAAEVAKQIQSLPAPKKGK